jgi:hypothetical protein
MRTKCERRWSGGRITLRLLIKRRPIKKLPHDSPECNVLLPSLGLGVNGS